MKIDIVAVGRLKEPYWRDAAAEYLKRLQPYAVVRAVEVADRDVTRDERRALAEEGADVVRALPSGAHVVAMEIGGRQRSSVQISEWLQDLALHGCSDVVFVVGGASGLDASVLARADERLSFGPITLPHQLARVVLLEQLYRAFRIARHEPYHR